MNLSTAAAIFIGGGAGSVARWMVGSWISKLTDFAPAGVLGANLIATTVLALLVFCWADKLSGDGMSNLLMPLIAIGFCGGFSTFSTFSLDTVKLFQDGNTLWAVANIVVSIVTCLGVVAAISSSFGKS
jgi:CrcB protein